MNQIAHVEKKSEIRVGLFKNIRASICKHCPACNHARKSPESIVGKILHHPVHSKHCPIWKAYQEVYGDESNR